MNPKISIITITYNSEKTLERTIQSVVSQDYDNFEYIIIDGASTDNTLKIVQKYRSQIAKVVSEPDKGISDAFNKGIHAASGEIIGLINSDDLLLPGALKNVAENYEPGIDIFIGNMFVNNDAEGYRLLVKPSVKYPADKRVKICHQSTFITADAYRRWGCFRVDFRYMMDRDLLARMYNGGAKIKHIDKELAVFNTGGITDHTPFLKGCREYAAYMKYNGVSRLKRYYLLSLTLLRRIAKTILIASGLFKVVRYFKYQKVSL